MKIIKIIGGLGNQMFQYAFYKSLKEIDENTYLDISDFHSYKLHNGFEIEKIFGIKFEKNNLRLIEELMVKNYFISKIIRKILRTLKIVKIVSQEDNLYLPEIKYLTGLVLYQGYWQTEKYFKKIEEKIKEEFSFPELTERKNKKLELVLKNINSVSIHVRRGDYIGHPYLDGLAPIEYYERAIKYIKERVENPIFLIFSNDTGWCKENLSLEKEEMLIVDWNKGEKSYRDMQLMSLCKHNIITNSSFSWWGAWLNSNIDKIVIAPEKWFTDFSKFHYEDIIPEKWIKIKNY